MRKKVPIAHLRVGMYVVGLDMSWLETPFFSHRMMIETTDQIEKLLDSGVQLVEIDTEKGDDLDEERKGPSFEEFSKTATATPTSAETSTLVPERIPNPFEDELPKATKVYKEAKGIVSRAMNDVRMGKDINMDAVEKVVEGLADSVLRNIDALTSLSRLKSFDEYTFFHSVNTSVLALALGRSQGMGRDQLQLLGVGTLLHDIGKMKVPTQILNKPDRLKDFEYEIIKQHTLCGAEILSKTTGLKEECIRPALEHHERVDGTGYPHKKKRHQLAQFGLISSVVDVYDAVTSDRCYHKGMPPYKALQFLYTLGQKGHLDPLVVQQFIRCVGVYPVGSCVRLNTGEIAVVSQIHHEQSLTPKVLIAKDGAGKLLKSPKTLDLADEDQAAGRSITDVLHPSEAGIEPNKYLGTPTF